MVKLKRILWSNWTSLPKWSQTLGICLLICLTSITVFAAGKKLMSVQVKKGQLRSNPSFLGKIVETLSYGERVEVLEEKVDWMKVGLPGSGASGWIHNSALTKKKIQLRAGKEVAGVSDSELVIAGKGFTKQVEEEFKLENQEIDYTWIDRMEAEFVVSQDEIQHFLEEGNLSTEGGAL